MSSVESVLCTKLLHLRTEMPGNRARRVSWYISNILEKKKDACSRNGGRLLIPRFAEDFLGYYSVCVAPSRRARETGVPQGSVLGPSLSLVGNEVIHVHIYRL